MKTGILGGTFDPVHNGHLRIAEEAMKQIELDEVLFMPASRSPFKIETCETPVEDRVRMVELAIEGLPGFSLSEMEINRPGTSYTVDTLEMLQDRSENSLELYFIIGLDSLETFPRWREPEKIVRLARLVTVCRPGYAIPHLEEIEEQVPGLTANLVILNEPLIDISSTDIRQRLQKGLPVHDMIPPKVEAYIREHRLYMEGK